MKSEPWDALTDPRLYRQNANLQANVAFQLTRVETAMDQLGKWCVDLGLDPDEELGSLLDLTTRLSGWSRAPGSLGSKQLVEMSIGAQRGTGLEGTALSPSLAPPNREAKTTAIVMYNGAKELGRDVKRKRWPI